MSKISPIEYADRVLSQESLPQIIRHNKSLYIYQKELGYYSSIDEQDLEQFVHDYFIAKGIPTLLTPNLSAQIIWAMKLSPRLPRVPSLNNHGNLIILKNGIIDLDEDPPPKTPYSLIPHSPDYYFTSAVNVDYDPNCDRAPYFLGML